MIQTTQGTGPGAAAPLSERYPRVVAAGHCVTTGNEGHGNWQVRVTLPEGLCTLDPHKYVVMTQQDDYANDDGRNQYPAHIEKLDAEGNNEDEGYTGGFGGFIIHTGDSNERRFMWTVITTGFAKNNS